MLTIATILFENFETLDVFGPIEVLGRFPEHFSTEFYSENGGTVSSVHKVSIVTKHFSEIPLKDYALLIPGGIGTRSLVGRQDYINTLRELASRASHIITVCTGSILFSKTGLLDGKRATSNKRVFTWALNESPQVNWIKKARWVRDGNICTSSGVSAGIDMAFGFAADMLGYDAAKKESVAIEYDWKDNPDWDPFADLY